MQFLQQYGEQDVLGQMIDTTLSEFLGHLNIRISTIDEVIRILENNGGPARI